MLNDYERIADYAVIIARLKENMENDLQLIRINTNYIHNDEQLKTVTGGAGASKNSILSFLFHFIIIV